MRRLIVVVITSALLAGAASCRRQKKLETETVEEAAARMVSTVHVADPKTTGQLLSGFHQVEQNAWRWTEGKFTVALKPPLTSSQKGATLNVKLAVPASVFQRMGPVTLSASVNGTALPPETFKAEGEAVYQRDVPASALALEKATVEFTVDKPMPAGALDQRELGIIITTVGLQAK